MDVFEGVKVLDFSWVLIGPLTTKFLAEHGATVIRIEAPIAERQDITRSTPPFKDNTVGLNRSGCFTDFNSNKHSITIDLSHPQGIEVAKRLVAWADIVVENFAPGVMERWGLDYQELSKIKPDIIMVSLSMQGQTGPRAKHPGLGLQLVALSGFTHVTGWPDRDPSAPYSAYTDFIGHYYAAAALMAALHNRRRTGKGCYLDISQYEAGLQFMAPLLLDYAVNKQQASRKGNASEYGAPHGIYRCRGDDQWCAIAVFSNEEWRNLCHVVGNSTWTRDPRFSATAGRLENVNELDRLLEEWTVRHSAEDVMAAMQASGVRAGIAESGKDLHSDPHLKERKFLQVLNHREMGPHSYRRLPFKLSKTPGQLRMPSPCLGQDTEYVCTKILRMSDIEFLELLEAGVVGHVPT